MSIDSHEDGERKQLNASAEDECEPGEEVESPRVYESVVEEWRRQSCHVLKERYYRKHLAWNTIIHEDNAAITNS